MPRRRARFAVLPLAALALLVTACHRGGTAAPPAPTVDPFVASSGAATSDTSASGASERSDISGTGDVEPLTEGDCFNVPTFQAGVAIDPHDVSRQPCAVEHQHEVYAVLTHPAPPGSLWPGPEALDSWGNDHCLALFTPYVGVQYELSSLDLAIVRPDKATWATGDRTVACTLHDSTFTLLTGSMKLQRR